MKIEELNYLWRIAKKDLLATDTSNKNFKLKEKVIRKLELKMKKLYLERERTAKRIHLANYEKALREIEFKNICEEFERKVRENLKKTFKTINPD